MGPGSWLIQFCAHDLQNIFKVDFNADMVQLWHVYFYDLSKFTFSNPQAHCL